MLEQRRALEQKDFYIGLAIALVVGLGFTQLSVGMSLIVTLLPGLFVTLGVYALLYIRQTEMPEHAAFLPWFFVVLALQFLHFAEKFAMGFATEFPILYDSDPYAASTFVSLSMLSFAVFSLSAVLALVYNMRWLLMPALFFMVYSAIGSAVTHTWWSLYMQSYFPGLYTGLLYWIVGPLLLYKLLGDRKAVAGVVIALVVVIVPLLAIFITPLP